MGRRKLTRKIVTHLLLLPFLIFALFPFYHMMLTSLKQDRELYDRHAVPLIIKQGPTLEHYSKLLWDTEFLTWTKNSLLVTVLATSVSVLMTWTVFVRFSAGSPASANQTSWRHAVESFPPL